MPKDLRGHKIKLTCTECGKAEILKCHSLEGLAARRCSCGGLFTLVIKIDESVSA